MIEQNCTSSDKDNRMQSRFLTKMLSKPHVIALISAIALSCIVCLFTTIGSDGIINLFMAAIDMAKHMSTVCIQGVIYLICLLAVSAFVYITWLAVHVLVACQSTRYGTILCVMLIVVAAVCSTTIIWYVMYPMISSILLSESASVTAFACLLIVASLSLVISVMHIAHDFVTDKNEHIHDLCILHVRKAFSFADLDIGLVLTHAGMLNQVRYVILRRACYGNGNGNDNNDDNDTSNLLVFDKLKRKVVSINLSINDTIIKRLIVDGCHIEDTEYVDCDTLKCKTDHYQSCQ